MGIRGEFLRATELQDVIFRVEQAELEVSRLKKQIDVHEKERKSQRDTEKRREEEATER